MSELTPTQQAALDRLKSSTSPVKLPAITGSKLVSAGLARKAEASSGERGHGMYVAA